MGTNGRKPSPSQRRVSLPVAILLGILVALLVWLLLPLNCGCALGPQSSGLSALKNLRNGEKPGVHVAHAFGEIDGIFYTDSRDAFLLNYERGFRTFEVDLVLLQDGSVFCAHDGTEWMYGLDKPFTETTATELAGRLCLGKYTPLTGSGLLDLINEYTRRLFPSGHQAYRRELQPCHPGSPGIRSEREASFGVGQNDTAHLRARRFVASGEDTPLQRLLGGSVQLQVQHRQKLQRRTGSNRTLCHSQRRAGRPPGNRGHQDISHRHMARFSEPCLSCGVPASASFLLFVARDYTSVWTSWTLTQRQPLRNSARSCQAACCTAKAQETHRQMQPGMTSICASHISVSHRRCPAV